MAWYQSKNDTHTSTVFFSGKHGMAVGVANGTPPTPSRAPVPPPEIPTLPVMAAIIAMARELLPPLE